MAVMPITPAWARPATAPTSRSSSLLRPRRLTTTASASVIVGVGSISDTATLAGGVNPTGTITFSLYGPNDATCSTAAIFTTTRTVAGNNSYTSASFTPTAAGTYRWTASYNGDANNTGVSEACNGNNESVTVTPATPAIAITKLPASQTIASGATATFTIAVTNTGTVTLSNVFVTDALSPNCNETSVSPGASALASMAPGASFSYTWSLWGVTAGFTIVAIASVTPPTSANVTATASAVVLVTPPPGTPAISITKLPASQTIAEWRHGELHDRRDQHRQRDADQRVRH